jgi:hypothetical protein
LLRVFLHAPILPEPLKMLQQQPSAATFRGHGCWDLLIYCGSIDCSYGAKMNADHLSDETPIRPLGDRMVCSRCSHRDADVRPNWSPHTNRRPLLTTRLVE